jgi:hypothetical protein
MVDLDETRTEVLPRVHAEFRRMDLDSLSALGASFGDVTIAEFSKRLSGGRHCYAAWVSGQPAAYGWVSFHEEHIGELNLRVRLLAGEAYIWDCVTLLAYREKYLYSALLSYILDELRAEHYCRAWIGADLENVVSQKGMARAGFHHIADLAIRRVLTIRQAWVLGLPGVPESIVAEARRVFLNDRDKVWLNSVSARIRLNSSLE